MSTRPAIQIDRLAKRYRIGTAGKSAANSAFPASKGTTDYFWALHDISLEIMHGETVGFLGLNGAGKSTLFKILSRITNPTLGTIGIQGRLGALLEVGTGFHGDLTGRENVFLYGAILGMGKAEITRKFSAIVDFSEVGKFIDTPVKRYSSGMYVKLAFAVAAHLEPDILLLDEVLAVGDLPFQRKCLAFTRKLQERDSTILFVSHNMSSIKNMCDRVIYLESGSVKYDGPTDRGISLYEEDCRQHATLRAISVADQYDLRITSILVTNEHGKETTVFNYGEPIRIKLAYKANRPLRNPNFIVIFTRSDGMACCNYSSEADGFQSGEIEGSGELELSTPPVKLVADGYSISVIVRSEGFQNLLAECQGPGVHIRHDLFDSHFGVFHESSEWRHV